MKKGHIKKISILTLIILVTIIASQFIISAGSTYTRSQMVTTIYTKYKENTWVGSPVTGYTSVTGGLYRQYKNAYIYFNDKTGKAYLLYGDIYKKWKATGGVNFLGLPTTDESATPDGVGRYNHFDKGSIYWTPLSGAHEVHGLIRNKWSSMGWEKCNLGYPISDELTCADGVGRYSKFQGGAIYYHPTYGTHPITENLYLKFLNSGKEAGTLGYPKADQIEYSTPVTLSIKETSTTTKSYTLATKSYRQTFSKGYTIYDNATNAKKVDLRPEIIRKNIAIDDQGSRGTCSVFAMNFLLEYAYTGFTSTTWFNNLSQEYLNHMTNKASNMTCDGDIFSRIAKGYNTYGIIPNSFWPYNPSATYNYTTYDSKVTQTMLDRGKWTIAKGNKLHGKFVKPGDGVVGLNDTQFKNVLAYLYKGIPVAIGRGHSMVIVGYTIDTTKAGGGEFIFRNSWGTSDGDKGYRAESFQSVKSTTCDAYVYDYLIETPKISTK